MKQHLEQTGMAHLPHPCPEAKQHGLQGVCRVQKYSGVMVLPSGRAFLRKKPRHKAGVGLLGITATLMDHEAR